MNDFERIDGEVAMEWRYARVDTWRCWKCKRRIEKHERFWFSKKPRGIRCEECKKVGTPDIICTYQLIDCEKLVEDLRRFILSPADTIYIEDEDALIERFIGDENVYWRFREENNVAMNRGMDAYPEVPLEILVAADKHPDYDEVIISVLHELAHLRGIQDEGKAEDFARSLCTG